MTINYDIGAIDLVKLFEKSEELLCVLDKEGKIIFHTKPWINISGFEALNIDKRMFSSLLYDETDRTQFDSLYNKAIIDSHTASGKLRLKKGNTSFQWLHLTLMGNEGKSVLVIAKQDHHEEKLKESEERYNLALQGISAGVWDMFDMEKQLLYLSPKFLELLGMPYEDRVYTAQEMSLWVAPDQIDNVWASFYAHLDKDSPFFIEAQFIMADGTNRWFLINGKSKRNEAGQPLRMVGSIVDIQARKEAEVEALRAKELVEEVSRLKSNFLSNMSHEIRTPLNGIIGLGNLIAKEKDLNKIRELVELQKQSSKRLLYTLTSILSFAKLETDVEYNKLKKVNVVETVKKAFSSLQELGKSKDLNMKLIGHADNLICLGDESQYYQVFHNLIHNAIKFTVKGNIIVETGKTGLPGNYRIFIKISDTGVGMSDEFKEKIFEPFTQESMGENRSYEGSGISLAFSKRYIELLGGAIHVTSRKDNGSTFEILLPCVA